MITTSMVDSDEDDDSYVCLGESIGPASADEPAKNPVSVHDLEVRDSQGRVRFHGAFTGGFSAGYFNTVGTKEGWKPSTFVSNRENRQKQKAAVPEDFMDEEDFGEHGIAPRQIVTSDNFKSVELQRKRTAVASAITADSLLSGLGSTLLDLIVPEKLTIGVRLLRKMGWKEGQGVGPRYEKHKIKKKKKSDGAKMYGCTLPDSGSESEASDEYVPGSVTFAPKDICPISFVPKDNAHGLGYSGINIKAALPSGHISLFSEPYSTPQPKSHKRKGIQGAAFGVGALEEDDDDIYTLDSFSNYDQSIGGPEVDDNLFGWTAPGRNKPGEHLPSNYVGKILDGFTLASAPLHARKVYSLPVIPKDYKPFHVFKEISCDLKPLVPDQKNQQLNAHSRSILLGEISTEGSVFDLLKKDDANRLAKLSESNQKTFTLNDISKNQIANCDLQSEPISTTDKSPTFTPAVDSSTSPKSSIVTVDPKQEVITMEHDKLEIKPFKIQTTQLPQTSNCLQAGFQPFAKDPDKQERYDRYLLLLKHGKIDPYDDVSAGCEMTEWEQKKEKDEFFRAAKIFKPLSGLMASRFTAAKFTDEDSSAEMPIDDSADKNDLSRAADMKLFGKLTRETFEWHPDQLLCRRFNVPDPHPGSGIIGIPKIKRDKYSIFNFLEATQSKDIPAISKQSEKTKILSASTTASPSTVSVSSTPNSKNAAHQDKPSIFSHLMDHSPAERKQTLPPAAADKCSESSTSTQSLSKTDSVTENKDDERPPLDLFKAIFADSSSSEDEDEEDEVKEVKPKSVSGVESHNGKLSSVTMTTENSIKDLTHPSDKTSSLKSNPEASIQSKFWECLLSNEKEEASNVSKEQQCPLATNQEKDSSDGEAYGPALPPTLMSSEGHKDETTSCLDNELLSLMKSPSAKKHKHKSKHKSKKSKKVKHKHKKEKRHKDKKKKKHSSSKRKDSSLSSSASSPSSSNVSPVHRKKKNV